jgi:hypothetical protein
MNPIPYELATSHRAELLRQAAIRRLTKPSGSTSPAAVATQRRRSALRWLSLARPSQGWNPSRRGIDFDRT